MGSRPGWRACTRGSGERSPRLIGRPHAVQFAGLHLRLRPADVAGVLPCRPPQRREAGADVADGRLAFLLRLVGCEMGAAAAGLHRFQLPGRPGIASKVGADVGRCCRAFPRAPRSLLRSSRTSARWSTTSTQPSSPKRRTRCSARTWTNPGGELPLGISFFTFTQIAFLVDVYQRQGRRNISSDPLRPVRHLLPAPHRRPDPAPQAR